MSPLRSLSVNLAVTYEDAQTSAKVFKGSLEWSWIGLAGQWIVATPNSLKELINLKMFQHSNAWPMQLIGTYSQTM